MKMQQKKHHIANLLEQKIIKTKRRVADSLGSSQFSPLPHATFSIAKINFFLDTSSFFAYFHIVFFRRKENASLCHIAAQVSTTRKKCVFIMVFGSRKQCANFAYC